MKKAIQLTVLFCVLVFAACSGEETIEMNLEENAIVFEFTVPQEVALAELNNVLAIIDGQGGNLRSSKPRVIKSIEATDSKGKPVDKIKSYCAMRKISTKRDANGFVRIQLNNKDYFQFGLLDQGWWPDGLYTAPTDEALVYDIKKTKDNNTCRQRILFRRRLKKM